MKIPSFSARTRRRLRLFAVFWLIYAVLCLPALIWPGYLDSAMGLLLVVPYMSIYLFDMLGIPGLLQNNGLCGWGWCAPSTFGWTFLIAVWLGVSWLLAWMIDRITAPARPD